MISDENNIKSIFIPTADRSENLKPVLENIILNLKKYGENAEIVVVDDSRNKKSQDANIEMCQNLIKDYPQIKILTKQDRLEAVKEVVSKHSISPEVAEFAFLGKNLDGMTTLGAVRNFCFHVARGKKIMFWDDDVMYQLKTRAQSKDLSFMFESNNPFQYELLESTEDFEKKLKPLDESILNLHQRFLGKTIGEITKEDALPGTEELTVSFVATGVFGDSPMKSHLPLMYNQEFITNQIQGQSEEEYEKIKTYSQIIQTPQSPTFYDGVMCFATNSSVDCSKTPPPFMPVGRAQDLIFGTVFHKTSSHYSLYLSEAIKHQRPDTEKRKPGFLPKDALGFTNRLLSWILIYTDIPISVDIEENIKKLGLKLKEVSQLSDKDFENHLRNLSLLVRRSLAGNLHKLLDLNPNTPDKWKTDINEIISNVLQIDFPVFTDIPIEEEYRCREFKELVFLYGEVMEAWPKIINDF